MALTAAMTAGTDLTTSATHSLLAPTTSLAEVPMQSPASLALAQTSAEAGMFIERVQQMDLDQFNEKMLTLSRLFNDRASGGVRVFVVSFLQ